MILSPRNLWSWHGRLGSSWRGNRWSVLLRRIGPSYTTSTLLPSSARTVRTCFYFSARVDPSIFTIVCALTNQSSLLISQLFLFSFFPRTLPRILWEWESREPGREGQMESTQVRIITHVKWKTPSSLNRHTVLHQPFVSFLPPGLTFWERHEALAAANPPTSEGACVLIALKLNCEGTKLVLRCFSMKKWWKKKKGNTMNRIHQEECRKIKNRRNTSYKSELKKLSYGNWRKMPLQHINYQWWGTVCCRGIQPLLPPSLDVCLLCGDMFTTIESTVTGKTTL